jgi:hypothetical protein
MTFASIRLVVAVAFMLALAVAPARAAQSSTSARTTAADLCSAARSVASQIVTSTSVSNIATAPSNLKATYLKIQAAEPSLLSAASGPQKTELKQVFGFLNLVIADLKKANWSVAALAPQFSTLEAKGAAVQKPLNALDLYFKNTCKFKT